MAYRGYRTYPRSALAFNALLAVLGVLVVALMVFSYLFLTSDPINFHYAVILAPLAVGTATVGLILLGNLERGDEKAP